MSNQDRLDDDRDAMEKSCTSSGTSRAGVDRRTFLTAAGATAAAFAIPATFVAIADADQIERPNKSLVFFTANGKIVNMVVYVHPKDKAAENSVELQVKGESDEWSQVASADLEGTNWYQATFSITDWDASADREIRIVHSSETLYKGMISKSK